MWKKPENEAASSAVLGTSTSSAPSTSGHPVRERSAERSLIGGSLLFKGDLSGDEDLFIDGQVEGSITLKQNSVTIGKNGRVTANVYAKIISVEGEMIGDLIGGEQVIVHRSGRVRGNITAPRVTLEDGAKLKGAIDMDPKQPEQGGEQSAKRKGAAPETPQTAAHPG